MTDGTDGTDIRSLGDFSDALDEAWNTLRPQADDAQQITPAESLYLNRALDDLINTLRTQGSPRLLLVVPAQNDASDPDSDPTPDTDLLDTITDGDVTKMPQLDRLRDWVEANTALAEWDATVAVAIVGFHCGLLDGNFHAVNSVRKWCNDQAPKGVQPDNHAALLASIAIGCLDPDENEPANVGKFENAAKLAKRHAKRLEAIVGTEEATEVHRRLLLHLAGASTALPAKEWRDQPTGSDTNQSSWFRWVDEIDTAEIFDRSHSRFQATMAQVMLARNDLEEANKRIRWALAHTKAHMTWQIERCNQLLFSIQIEDAARNDITAEITESAANQVQVTFESAQEKFNEVVTEKTAEFDQKNRADTAEQINTAVLRVVEILGIFVAISFVLFTGLEGFVSANTIGEALTVYGVGFGSVVVLMGLIYVAVWRLQQHMRETQKRE